MDTISEITATLRDRIEPNAWTWLQGALEKLAGSDDVSNDLANLSAMARRKIGSNPIGPGFDAINTPSGEVSMDDWPASDAARISLILQGLAVTEAGEPQIALVDFVFRHGDETERAAIARGLALIDPADTLKAQIREAGRANSLQLVGAVTLDNPYPAAWYSEHEFNQLVLKALFLELSLARIVGLQQRCNPALSRMCEDYYDERTSAHRHVPADIWLALGPYASERGEQLLLDHLSHDTPEHRCYSAMAAGRRLDERPQWRAELEARTKTETDPQVLTILRNSIR